MSSWPWSRAAHLSSAGSGSAQHDRPGAMERLAALERRTSRQRTAA